MAKRPWIFSFPFFRSKAAKIKARDDVQGIVNALDHAVVSVQQEAKKVVMSLLHNGDTEMRRKFVSALATSRNTVAIEALCEALKDEDGYVRLLAVRTLEENADARAVAPLIKIAQDAKASVHVQTVLRSVLYRAADTVPSDALRQAAQMNDSYVLIFAQVDTSCTFTTYNVTSEEADFSQIKQLARQELIKRGLDV